MICLDRILLDRGVESSLRTPASATQPLGMSEPMLWTEISIIYLVGLKDSRTHKIQVSMMNSVAAGLLQLSHFYEM